VSEFELRIGGKKFSGWTAASVTRSLTELAHKYTVTLTDKWVQDMEAVPIEEGDPVQVWIGTHLITSGYIDEESLTYNSTERTLSFTGRSKTGDLVDCTAIHKGGQWRKKKLLQIVTDICEPFGIDVTARTGLDLGKAFTNPNFKLQEGETAFSAIARAARMRGVLTLTDGGGNLFIDRAGGAHRVFTKLERGVNILSATKKTNGRERFKEYTVKTQASGNDDMFGKATSIHRHATDAGVNRYRPLTVQVDNEDSGTELQKRVNWERNVRAGKAKSYSCVVEGWEHANGIWKPNTLVRVLDPDARLDDELLIAMVKLTRDSQGTRSELGLTFPEAFDIQPLPKPKKKGGSLF